MATDSGAPGATNKPFLFVVKDTDGNAGEQQAASSGAQDAKIDETVTPSTVTATPAASTPPVDTLPPLPPLPSLPVERRVVPESANLRSLRQRVSASGDSLVDATRLAAVGLILARGAAELRPCMSAESAKAWAEQHAQDVGKACASTSRIQDVRYEKIADLKDAVFGAGAEVDEAADAAKAPGLADAIYAVVRRAEGIVTVKTTEIIGAATEKKSGHAALYLLGTDVLSSSIRKR